VRDDPSAPPSNSILGKRVVCICAAGGALSRVLCGGACGCSGESAVEEAPAGVDAAGMDAEEARLAAAEAVAFPPVGIDAAAAALFGADGGE
jgi:hypothetical protein